MEDNELTEDDNQDFQCDGSATYAKLNIIDKETKVYTKPYAFTKVVPVYTTYWQSENTVPTQRADPIPHEISINLTDIFLVNSFIIAFINPKSSPEIVSDARPQQVVIDKLGSNGEWQAMRYFAADCNDFPELELKPKFDVSPAKVYCEVLRPPNLEHGGHIQQVG